MPDRPSKLFEIWVRKGENGGPFQVADEATTQSFRLMCGIAKELVDKGHVDEAVVLEKREVRRFRKYVGEG